MFYYAINKASNSLKLPPVKKLDLTKFVISIFMKICSIFIKIESYEASRKLVYNFLADALVRPLTNLAFSNFLQVKRIFMPIFIVAAMKSLSPRKFIRKI